MAPGTELRKAYDTEPQAQQVVDVARGLEGIVRNNSIHAAAVVIADRPLTEIVPLQLAEDRGAVEVPRRARTATGRRKPERVYKTVTQYSMKPIEEIGLLKMDFLGLRTLDVLENAVAIIERSGGEPIDLTNLPLDDRKTYEMLARGDSVGRVPARVRGHAGRAARGRADRVRRHRRAGRAVPPGPDALHQGLRARQARPGDRALHRRAPEADHRAHVRHRGLPGAADADRARHRRLPGPEGGHAAPRDRQEGARADGDAQAGLRRGLHARAARTRRSRTSSGA